MKRSVILHSPPKKEPLKVQPKMGYVLYEDTYQAGPFAGIPVDSKVYNKMFGNTLMDVFFIKNQFQTDPFEAFVKSFSRVLSTSSLSTAIAARLLTNFTFVMQTISEYKFLMIFCCTKLLFPRHSESVRTLLSSRPTAQSVQENFLKKFSDKFSQEYNCISPKSKQQFREIMSVMEFVLFSATLRTLPASSVSNHFAIIQTKQHSMKPTNRKKDNGFIYSISL